MENDKWILIVYTFVMLVNPDDNPYPFLIKYLAKWIIKDYLNFFSQVLFEDFFEIVTVFILQNICNHII